MIYYLGEQSLIQSSLYKICTLEYIFQYFKDHEYINLDTETTGKDVYSKDIILVQLGDFENQFILDIRYLDIYKLKSFLEQKSFILHNAKFDYKFFKHKGITIEHLYDTMLSECIIYTGYNKFGYSLGNLTQRYLGITLDKSTRLEFSSLGDKPLTEKQILYSALDVKYLGVLREHQLKLIKKYNLEYCLDLENQVLKALGDIEYNGIILDQEKWLRTALEADTSIFEIQRSLDTCILQDPILKLLYKPNGIQNLFNFEERQLDINYRSPQQVKKVFEELGYPVLSTNDKELKKLVHKHQFFAKLQEYRKTAKVVSTYGKDFLKYINPITKKVHTSYWQILNTGRVSSGSKDDNAPNLQNIPADNKFRNAFIPRSGFLWISGDYSGQELRLMADGSNEPGFIEVLNRGEDLHSYVGSMMMNQKITKEDKEIRTQAKTINFMKPYGGGPKKLADLLNISLEKSEELFKLYERSFPKLNKWLKEQGKLAKKQMYSTSFAPCKRRRWYPDMLLATQMRTQIKNQELEDIKENWKRILQIEGQTERNGGNQPIQGSGADITKEALVQIRNLINSEYRNQAYLICTVHDSIDVEVQKDLAQEFADKMRAIMISCGNKYVSKVQMEVDISINSKWQK